MLETGAEGLVAGRQSGSETANRAKSVTGRISSGIAERVQRRRGDDD